MDRFSELPSEIRLLVFKHVRREDLYETGRVSQQWFVDTVSSYSKPLRKKDLLLKDLIKSYNENSGEKRELKWPDLAAYIGSKEVVISGKSSKPVLDSILKHGDRITSLCFGEVSKKLVSNILCRFPQLTTLEMPCVDLDEKSPLKIPKTVENVVLPFMGSSSSLQIAQLFEDPNAVKSMRVEMFSIMNMFMNRRPNEPRGSLVANVCGGLDLNMFANLTKLTTSLSNEHMLQLLQMIKAGTRLSYLKLARGAITKEWRKVFPKSVAEVHLAAFKLSKEVKNVLGNDILYERQLLFYIFQDWKSVELFTCKQLEHMDWDNSLDLTYHATYKCKAKSREEYVHIDVFERYEYLRDLTFSDSELSLRSLIITKRRYNELLYDAVPASVKCLEFRLEMRAEAEFSPYDVCEDPTTLERLYVHQMDERSFEGAEEDCFRGMVNLKTLMIPRLSGKCIANLLQHCTALEDLVIINPRKRAFRRVPASVKSNSVKKLRIELGDDTLADILKHFPNLQSLIVGEHSSSQVALPDVQMLSSLRFLLISCKFTPHVADEVDKIPLPFAMFFPCDYLKLGIYMVGSDQEFFRYAFADKVRFAYARGFSTRSFKARGIKILTTPSAFDSTFERKKAKRRNSSESPPEFSDF